jgi:hypothetical protein
MRFTVLTTALCFLIACEDDRGTTPDMGSPRMDAASDTPMQDAPLQDGLEAGPISCNYKGTLYPDGAEFPADDGCNMCKCNTGGKPGVWGCSQKLCGDGGPASETGGNDAQFEMTCQGPNGGVATHGTVFSSGNLCCTCTATGQSAPTTQCAPPVTTVKCSYGGAMYDDGAVFPAGDGCNTCKCNPSGCNPGQVGCSLIGCNTDAGTDSAH